MAALRGRSLLRFGLAGVVFESDDAVVVGFDFCASCSVRLMLSFCLRAFDGCGYCGVFCTGMAAEIEGSGVPAFRGRGKPSGSVCGRNVLAVWSSRFVDCAARFEEEKYLRVWGHWRKQVLRQASFVTDDVTGVWKLRQNDMFVEKSTIVRPVYRTGMVVSHKKAKECVVV